MAVLHVRGPATGSCRRNSNRRHELTGLKSGREHVDEELVGRELALAVLAGDDDRGAERLQHRRVVGGRVGVRDAAADRPAVADEPVADLAGGLRDDRADADGKLRARDVGVRGERADRQLAVRGDLGEPGNPPDVDERGRRCQPHLHQRQEAVPTREHLGIVEVGE
jgi:hypothetical protein